MFENEKLTVKFFLVIGGLASAMTIIMHLVPRVSSMGYFRRLVKKFSKRVI